MSRLVFVKVRVAISVMQGFLLALAVLAASGCHQAVDATPPPAPTVGVVESRRMSVPIEVVAQWHHPRPRGRDDPGTGSRLSYRAPLRRRCDGQERAALLGDRRRAVRGHSPIGPSPPGRGRGRSSQGRRIAAGERSRRHSSSSTRLSSCSPRSRKDAIVRSCHGRPDTAEDLDKSEADRKKLGVAGRGRSCHLDQAKADYAVGVAAARAQVAAAKAAVRDAELNLGYCRMYAPIDGRIGEARVKVGNLVGPDQAGGGAAIPNLATIQQLDPIGVDIWLSSRNFDRTTELDRKTGCPFASFDQVRRSGGASIRGPMLLHRQQDRRDHRPHSWSKPKFPTPAANCFPASTSRSRWSSTGSKTPSSSPPLRLSKPMQARWCTLSTSRERWRSARSSPG